MKFLIELNIFSENEEVFSRTLKEMRIDHCFWDGQSNPPYDKKDNKVFFIGSIINALKIKQLGYSWQVWLGLEFDYSYFGSHLNNLLNDDFALITHKRIIDSGPDLCDEEKAELIFARSNSGYKRFGGGVFTYDNYIAEAARNNIHNEEIMVFATMKEIAQEYRAVIKCTLNENSDEWLYEVVTYSQYAGQERELSNGEIYEIIHMLETSTYRQYPLFILDICIYEEKIKIVEANSINTSGYYECNFRRIVEEILEIEKTNILERKL